MSGRIFFKLTVIVAGISIIPPCMAENLLDVFESARTNDATYLAAVADFQAAREASPQAWSAVLPQLSLQGTHTEIDGDLTLGTNPTISDSYSNDKYTLSLKQTIYHQEQFDRISQADAEVAAAQARFENAKHDLILRVAQAYFNVLGAQDTLVFAQAEKQAIEQQLHQTRERFKVGLTAITDVHEAQARYDTAVASEIDANNKYAISLEALRVITNQQTQTLSPLKKETPLVSPEPANIDSWVQNALEHNLLLLAADKSRQAARHALGVARSGHYPTLDLQADYTNTDIGGGFNGPYEQEGSSVSLVLTLPLYSGGAVNAASRQAAARYEKAKQEHEFQRRNTVSLTRNTYLTVLSNISRVNALKQALRSTHTALEATQAGYEVGTRTAVDVLDSQRELFRAQRDYARSRYDYFVETLRLKQATGVLSDIDLKQINHWLE